MQNIYVITAEYGEWSDIRHVEMYVATEEEAARSQMQSLANQFSAAYAHMVEGLCHGIDPFDSIMSFTGDENVAKVARDTRYDEGVTLILSSMPVGNTFRNAEHMDRLTLSFYPEGWDESRCRNEGEELISTEYERLAEPYEAKFGV